MIRRSLLIAALSAGMALPASADTMKFHAVLAPSAEVPPTNSTGKGEADATFDTATHILTYEISFSGFASEVTMAHFHGPAPVGANAGVLVPLGMKPASPIKGTATLTPDQETQLRTGLWYVNVHTTNHPAGAIRGQMTQVR